ncbi:hypothetical protein LTR66_009688 [Elasticomyces elasticus]|nr:hypothetical protein LTR66_009688 [Elasticomyces elasticus]
MPPAKARQAQEDMRSESSSAKEKQAAAHAVNARVKKNGGAQVTASLRKAIVMTKDPATASNTTVPPTSIGMSWMTEDRSLLESYRTAYRVDTPSSFHSALNQALLTKPGIGRQSPTMARKREKRPVSKEQLALAVRRNFNGAAVNEIDVMVDLLYNVRTKDKALKMRFAPTRGK